MIYNFRALTKLNLKLLLDYEFLRDGYYTNVSSGEQFYDGSVISLLLPDTSADDLFANLADGQVWQSPFRNWTYESGVILNDVIGIRNLTRPIIASGIYAYGAFRPTDPNHPDYDADFAHTIDFINGRVIFNTPKPLDMDCHADFSYKHVRIGFEDDFNRQYMNGVLESKFTTNPLTSNQVVYPSGFAQPWPAIFIEVDERDFDSYELGNRSLIITDTVKCHVWTLDSMMRDNIIDTITLNMRKTIPMIDFNVAPLPLSGIFNTLSPEYIAYQELLRNPRIKHPTNPSDTVQTIGYTWSFEDASPRNLQNAEEFLTSRVDLDLRIWLITPNTPLGMNFGADVFRSGTENF